MLLMLPIGGALLVVLELVTSVEIVLLRSSNFLNNFVTNLWVICTMELIVVVRVLWICGC